MGLYQALAANALDTAKKLKQIKEWKGACDVKGEKGCGSDFE